jgi:hypothetical protein
VRLQKIIATELSTTTWVQRLNFRCRSFGNEIFVFGHTVKIQGPYLLSKEALIEDETPWLIKCQGKGNLNDVGHFNPASISWSVRKLSQ